MRGVILAICLFSVPAMAADGLPSGVPFDVPVVVEGKTTTGKALIQASSDAEKPLVIFYVGADGTLQTLSYAIRRGDSQPTPNPTPDPTPKPNPNRAAFLYWIHESKDSTPAAAVVRDDKTWRDQCDALGVRWLVLDVDQAAMKFPEAAKKARAKGLPALVWLDSQGVSEVSTPPKTGVELVAEIVRRAK